MKNILISFQLSILFKELSMWNTNAFTQKLGIQYPIIQGPFGGGLSTIELLTTVSNAGGLGSYGAHILSPSEIYDLVSNIKTQTNKPYAINLWVSDHDQGGLDINQSNYAAYMESFRPFYDELGIEPPTPPKKITERYEEQIAALIEAAPPIFSFVFGIPNEEVLERCHRKGIVTLGAATTVAEAVALEDAGVDIVLATGFEAGGHRVAFIEEPEESLIGSLALIPQIVDSVKVPVIAAGGIADTRGVRAALSLGAQGVQIGTAFLACKESGTSQLHKDILFSDAAKKTVLSRAFTGRLARFIPNHFIEQIENTPGLPLPFPMQSFFTSLVKKAASTQGNQNFSSLYAGQAAPLLKHRKAIELFDDIVSNMNVVSL